MLKRFDSGWKVAALLTFNMLVLILIANLLSWLVLALLPQNTGPQLDAEALLEAYPGFSLADIRQIQSETWGRDYIYEPFTQFKEGAIHGDFVNVDETGFRQAPGGAQWPPDPAATSIFVFGGSTTFGYGLDDGSTIPMALQRHLRSSGCTGVIVYNLARSNYFSTQERILFEQLVLEDHVPSAVVFIDGLNEFIAADGLPKFTERLNYLMAESREQLFLRALKQMPLTRLVRSVIGSKNQGTFVSEEASLEAAAKQVLARWERNRELISAIAASTGVSTLFVWQPIPDLDSSSPIPNARLLERGYEIQAGNAATGGFLWLADRGQHLTDALFVDRVHYSAAFSSDLGAEIAAALAPEICPGVPPELTTPVR